LYLDLNPLSEEWFNLNKVAHQKMAIMKL
jgi:hypothetical protein